VIFYRGRQDGYVSVFKKVDGQYPGSKLPDPQGALAQEVPARAISAANTEVFFFFFFCKPTVYQC